MGVVAPKAQIDEERFNNAREKMQQKRFKKNGWILVNLEALSQLLELRILGSQVLSPLDMGNDASMKG